ncbi:MAG: response regulator transcription factor [Anaerovoracaceae bacterium]|jgi:two-component system response regulator YesN
MIRALIIDDEPTVAKIITHFIAEDNMPIEIVGIAGNGYIGASMIRKLEPGLVFIDIQMPIMNGFEVIREQPDVSYIVITAFDSFEYAQESLRLGVKDILLKPIDHDQLVEAIRRAVGWSFTSNDVVNEIVEYIHGHYSERISLSELADMFYVTPGHISRLFKQHVGENVTKYINRVRIENAAKMLKQGCSVKSVSERVGYNNLNNFYMHFKEFEGTTPAAYAKEDKEEK